MISIDAYDFLAFGQGARAPNPTTGPTSPLLRTARAERRSAPPQALSDLGDLPSVPVDIGRNRLAREVRLAAFGVARESVELFAQFRGEPDRHHRALGHVRVFPLHMYCIVLQQSL